MNASVICVGCVLCAVTGCQAFHHSPAVSGADVTESRGDVLNCYAGNDTAKIVRAVLDAPRWTDYAAHTVDVQALREHLHGVCSALSSAASYPSDDVLLALRELKGRCSCAPDLFLLCQLHFECPPVGTDATLDSLRRYWGMTDAYAGSWPYWPIDVQSDGIEIAPAMDVARSGPTFDPLEHFAYCRNRYSRRSFTSSP